jgi:hypothetical protein
VRAFAGWRDWTEPTVRDRPVGLIASGVASAVAGVAVLLAAIELFAGAAAYRDWTKPKLVGNDLVGMVQVYPEHYVLMGAFLLLPALYLLALPIGIARQRPWAGIMGFVAGGLMALYGLLALVIPGDAASGEERWHPAASLPWIGLGLFVLWYFNRRSITADLGMGDRTFS